MKDVAGRGPTWLAGLPLGLAVAGLVYLLLRAALLWTNFDAVAFPIYELHPVGTLARSVLGPGRLPLASYYDNAGGELVTGFLAVPSFLAFGPTYLSLKLVPAGLGLAALATLYFFLRRHFDACTATLGALLFALAPTTLTKFSLVGFGNHFENVFFTLFTFFAFYRAHTSPHRDRWLVITGFAAGFAIFVFLGAITPVGLLFLVHLGRRGWRGTGRDLAFLVPAFLVGIAPLIALNLQPPASGFAFLHAKFSGGMRGFEAARFAGRVQAFLAEHLPAAGTYPSILGIPGGVAGAVFLGCFVAAYLFLLPEAVRGIRALALGVFDRGPSAGGGECGSEAAAIRGAILVPLVLYLPLTAVAFGMTDLVIGGYNPPFECGSYRYFLLHFTFAILLVAIAAGTLLRSEAFAARSAGLALAGLALATGLFNFALVDPGARDRNLGAHYEGSNFKQLARSLVALARSVPETNVVRHAEEFPPALRARVYEGLGFYGAYVQSGAATIDLAAVLAPYPPERRADVARGVGMFLRQPRGQGAAMRSIGGWRAQGVGGVEQVVEGIALNADFILSYAVPQLLHNDRDRLAQISADLQPGFARGFGMQCGRLLRRGIGTEEALVASTAKALRQDLREPFYSGLGRGLADGAEEAEIPPAARRLVPDSARAALEQGFESRKTEILAASGTH